MADWDEAPTILIFGDSEEGFATASEAALAQGGRIAAAVPIAQASDRLDQQVAVDLVVLDVSRDHGASLDQLLRRIEDAADARHFSSIVTIAPQLVDIATARIAHDDVSVLVGRDPEMLAQAMADGLARAKPQLALRDGGPAADKGIGKLRPDGDVAGHGPGDRCDGVGCDASCGGLPASIAALVSDSAETPAASLIRGMIRARRLRSQFFGKGLFADPAWDILLDLMAARFEGRSVAVSSLCIAAAVPATTALRWIKQLTEAGLLRRVSDPLDGRRVFIELTEAAVATLTDYFNTLVRGNPGFIRSPATPG